MLMFPYLNGRAIITPINEIVDEINVYLFSLMITKGKVSLSSDTVSKTSSIQNIDQHKY